MAVPFRRTSKTRKALRRANIHLAAPTLTDCPECGAKVRPHHVCKCGFYKSQKVK